MGAFFEIQDTIQRITEAIASVIGISACASAVCCPMLRAII
jgi:hypothetical protein